MAETFRVRNEVQEENRQLRMKVEELEAAAAGAVSCGQSRQEIHSGKTADNSNAIKNSEMSELNSDDTTLFPGRYTAVDEIAVSISTSTSTATDGDSDHCSFNGPLPLPPPSSSLMTTNYEVVVSHNTHANTNDLVLPLQLRPQLQSDLQGGVNGQTKHLFGAPPMEVVETLMPSLFTEAGGPLPSSASYPILQAAIAAVTGVDHLGAEPRGTLSSQPLLEEGVEIGERSGSGEGEGDGERDGSFVSECSEDSYDEMKEDDKFVQEMDQIFTSVSSSLKEMLPSWDQLLGNEEEDDDMEEDYEDSRYPRLERAKAAFGF